MANDEISTGRQLTRKRRKRNLRQCASFERGKCATCEKPAADREECDMKRAEKRKEDE